LQDHYAAGIGALELIAHREKAHAQGSLGPFFSQLRADVKADHDRLHDLIGAFGFDVSRLRDAGAWTAEKFARIKVGLSSGDDELSLLQALETLYIGITGKRLLWRALLHCRDSLARAGEIDLEHLEKRAIEQAERVETQRLATSRQVFRAA
jgi:hypothetical protein